LQEAEPAMMGRVMSLFATVLIGGMAIGGPIVTLEVAAAGPRTPFLVGAGTAAAALVVVHGLLRRSPHQTVTVEGVSP